MIFLDKSLELAIYKPELIPVVNSITIEAGKEKEIIRLSEYAVKTRKHPVLLSYFSQDRNSNVYLRQKIDDISIEEKRTDIFKAYPSAEERRFPVKKSVEIKYYNSSASDISGYKTMWGLWVLKPTLTEKLLYDIPIEKIEEELIKKYGADKSFEKGILPIQLAANPLNDLQTVLEREYQPIYNYVETREKSVAAGTTEEFFSIHVPTNKFILLREVSASASDAIIEIRRESKGATPIELDCAPLTLDFSVPTWLHAFNLLVINIRNPTGASITEDVRIKYSICRVSSIIKVKILGEIPTGLEELVERVKVGIW